MSNPTPYVPGYSYSGGQANNPTKPLPAPKIDTDFANIQRTTDETIAALADIRRSDGKLQNGVVTPESLSPGAIDQVLGEAVVTAVEASEVSVAASAASETFKDGAENAASAAALSATAAAMYDGPYVDDALSILSNVALTYTAGQPGTVTAGKVVRSRKEGFAWLVAAAGAVDHQITTAGGVKLYVVPIDGAHPLFAMGVASPARTEIEKLVAGGATVIDLGGKPIVWAGFTLPAGVGYRNGSIYTTGTTSWRVEDYAVTSGLIKLPTEITSWFPGNVWRNPNGSYGTDYDPATVLAGASWSTRYVSVNGNTGNNGLTPALPWPTVTYAVNQVATDLDIVLMDDEYKFDDWLYIGIVGRTGHIRIRTLGNKKVTLLGGRKGLVWTVNGTYPNVYSSPIANIADSYYASAAPGMEYGHPVLDRKVVDILGYAARYTRQTSIAAVAANPGSWYFDGAAVHVSRLSGTAPNDEILVCRPTSYISFANSTKVFWIENCKFLGSQGLVSRCTASSTDQPTVVAVDCEFEDTTSISLERAGGGMKAEGGHTIAIRCKFARNRRDGVNYHDWFEGGLFYNKQHSIEIDCVCVDNGSTGEGNNQGSTTHDGNKLLRLNGRYERNEGENISDVSGNTVSVTLGATLGPSYRLTSPRQVGVDGGAIMYLADIKASGRSQYDLVSPTAGGLRIYNSPGLRTFTGIAGGVVTWNPFA